MHGRAISFDPFSLLPEQRLLLEGDREVRLGSRALDILVFLVERAGDVVGKEELIARAWPKRFVEEANLKIQVAALRRALGDGQDGRRYVVTVPGRGYNFVAPVRRDEHARGPLPSPAATPTAMHNLPLAVTRMIGREEAVAGLISRLSRERMTTIVGPGGIGKTTLAVALAERMIADYEHGVWLIDLAPLSDPHLVPSTVATALGLSIRAEHPLHGLIAGLRDKRMLLLFDNCEHVIDAAASLMAAILSGAPGVNVLATSREPLGIAGEHEYHLGPLGSPRPSTQLTAAEAGKYPAVQLFVERAAAIVEDFTLTDANAVLVGEICRRLDGLPLAIEFAAPRIEVLGIEGLATRLDDSLPLLGTRRRIATPRHRTMRAVIDWSYGLLDENEQRFFRALGIFSGGFTVEAAAAVAMDGAEVGINALDRLAGLVTKSLVVADVSGAEPRFRLLGTTHAYAIEKLDERGERNPVARSHATYYRDLFELAEKEPARPAGEWMADHAWEIDNVRAALDWSFSADGEPAIGIALTATFAPVWNHLALIVKCRQRAELALDSLRPDTMISGQMRLRLHMAYAFAAMRSMSPLEKIRMITLAGAAIAEELNDMDAQLWAIWVLWMVSAYRGEIREALSLAQRASAVARRMGTAFPLIMADRLMGNSLHHQGDQTVAHDYLERAIKRAVAPAGRENFFYVQMDQRIFAHAMLARTLLLQGFLDQAAKLARTTLEEAVATRQGLTVCYVLFFCAAPVALLTGDLETAEQDITKLVGLATEFNVPFWRNGGRCLEGKLLIMRGDFSAGSALLRSELDACERTGWTHWYPEFLGALAEGLAGLGQFPKALAAVDQALEKADQGGERCYFSELLRLKGEFLLAETDGQEGAAIDDCFHTALQVARQQGALLLELRAALSFARWRIRQDRPEDAQQILGPVYNRFLEGFHAADLRAASALLATTSSGTSGGAGMCQ